MKKFELFLLALLLALFANAYDAEIDGICYDLKGNEAYVVTYGDYNYYTGTLLVPTSIRYKGRIYRVTSIGSYAFAYCKGLTSVTIPESVTSIGERAFYDCRSLTSVTIPNSVTSIRGYTFAYCTGLTSVTIPNSVTSIGDDVFTNCSSLTSINIPTSVTSIGSSAFYHCNGLTSVTIPESVTSIGNSFFYGCRGLTSVTIPNSVTSIGYSSFYGCSGLTSVTIPESVTSIGESAFYGCSGLTSVNIPNSVTSIGNWAFYGCSGLTSINIPNSVTSIGNGAFKCEGLTSITVERTLPLKIIKNTFFNLSHATLYVPFGSKKTYEVTDYWKEFNKIVEVLPCLEGIYYNFDRSRMVAEVNPSPTGEKYTGSIIIPPSVTYENETYSVTGIAANAFANCSGLTSVTIPKSISNIGGFAFQECSALTSVIISDISAWCNISFATDNSNPLYYANRLYLNDEEIKNLVIPEGVTSIGNSTFSHCTSLASVTIPNSVNSIGRYAFSGCTQLSSISIPNNVNDIGKEAFAGTIWYNIWYKKQKDGVLYIGKVAYKYKEEKKRNNQIKIKKGTTGIASDAFSSCTGLSNITLPNSITGIGDGAFRNCYDLTSINIPEKVANIGDSAFTNCYSLTSINIPENVTSIGESIFENCISLTSITIPHNVKSIGESAFKNCGQLSFLSIPNSVTSISDSAFYNCSGLTSVSIANSVTNIGKKAFYGCINLEAITFPLSQDITAFPITDETISLGDGAFGGCKSIKMLDFSNVSGEIPKNVCNGCKSLLTVKLSNNITTIADYAFYGCTNLKIESFPDSLRRIGDYAFCKCSSLKDVCIPAKVESLGFAAFRSCTSLENVSYPESLVDIHPSVFSWDNNLCSFQGNSSTPDERCVIKDNTLIWFAPHGVDYYQIPDKVRRIKDGCFEGLSDIKKVILPHSGVYIEYGAFWGSGIQEVTIPPFSTIGVNSFRYCNFLKKVVIEDGVNISSDNFRDCFRLHSLVLPANVTTIPKNFINNCDNFTCLYIQNSKDKVIIESDAIPSKARVIYKSPSDNSNEKGCPPILIITKNSLQIKCSVDDNELYSNSKYSLVAQVHNEGERNAQMCVAEVSLQGAISGVNIDDYNLYTIEPGKTKDISIPFQTSSDTRNGKVTFTLQVIEKNGYNSETASVTVPIYAHGTNQLSAEGHKHEVAAEEIVDAAKEPEDSFMAIEEYKRILDTDPSYSKAYYNIAGIYKWLGKEKDKRYYRDAKSYYIQYKRLVPEEGADIDAIIYALERLMKQ